MTDAPETDVRAPREALLTVLMDEYGGEREDWTEMRSLSRVVTVVERIVAERVRVVEGERDAANPGSCSQCGERMSAMVKVGTSDGWCTQCLDEAAEPTETLARAESAEAAHAALVAGVEALADEWAATPVDEDPWAFEKARDLRALVGEA